jgi:hypothetical protein
LVGGCRHSPLRVVFTAKIVSEAEVMQFVDFPFRKSIRIIAKYACVTATAVKRRKFLRIIPGFRTSQCRREGVALNSVPQSLQRRAKIAWRGNTVIFTQTAPKELYLKGDMFFSVRI